MAYFTAGAGSPLMKQNRNPWRRWSSLAFGHLKTMGDHCDGLKQSPTAAHNIWHHSSVKVIPSIRRSCPWLLAPLSISNMSRGYKIPMVGLFCSVEGILLPAWWVPQVLSCHPLYPSTRNIKNSCRKKIGSWVFECLGEFGWYGPGGDSSRATSPEICLIVPL